MYIQPSNFIEFLQCIPDLVLIWRFSHPEISDSFCSLGFWFKCENLKKEIEPITFFGQG